MRALLAAFAATLREVLTTRALVSTTLVAVLFYAFYYPAPYRHQSVVDLPAVVVDEEDTAITRQFVRALDDTREVAVTLVTRDPLAAEREVRERRADGIVRLGDGLTRRLLTGSGPGGVSLTLNGTYLLRAKAVGDALGAVLRGMIEERLEPLARPLGATLPIRIEARPLFNSTTGYADYIFPAVAIGQGIGQLVPAIAGFRILVGRLIFGVTDSVLGSPMVDAGWAFMQVFAGVVGFVSAVGQVWITVQRLGHTPVHHPAGS